MAESRGVVAVGQIPAVSAGPVAEEHVPVLLWVHTDTATVEVAGVDHPLSAHEAIWIPPGVMHSAHAHQGSVVLPIFPRLPELRGALAEVRVITIPRGWEEWLVFQFDFNRYHSLEARSGTSALLALVAESPARGADARGGSGAPPLPMPYSREALAVAQALLRSPGTPRRMDAFAARENISVRTLQRQFHSETGMIFSEWRTRARVAVAAVHLADGRRVGWTGRQVGYATPAGFTRAFQRSFGVAPLEYARRTRGLSPGAARPSDEATARLASLVADESREAPPVPSRQVWSWVYDWHVLWWAYRGTAEVRIGTRAFSLQQGEAIWLPAGFSASVTLAEGAILLPLGNRYGGRNIGVDQLSAFSLSSYTEAFLLHTLLAEYTLFRPDTDRARLADDLFRQQFVSGGDGATGTALTGTALTGTALTGAVATIARALRRDPADARSLAEWAAHLHLSPHRVGREFLTQTGSSFPRWRAQLRMSLARELLMVGDPPHEVARMLGYSSPAGFSRVFTIAHGISPRSYQRQVSSKLA